MKEGGNMMEKYQSPQIEVRIIGEDFITMSVSIPEDFGDWPSSWGGVSAG